MAEWQHRSDTRDPLEILVEREARTCKGCRFHAIEQCFGQQVEICGLRQKKVRHCTMYAEKP